MVLYMSEVKALSKISITQRNHKIRKAPVEFIKALVGFARAITCTDTNLTMHQIKSLYRQRKNFEQLLSSKTSLKNKRIILQSKGVLPALLSALLKNGLANILDNLNRHQ